MIIVLTIVLVNMIFSEAQLPVTVSLIADMVNCMVSMFVANRLVYLSKPPECYVCPVTNGKMNPLTKIKVDKELDKYVQSTLSKEDK